MKQRAPARARSQRPGSRSKKSGAPARRTQTSARKSGAAKARASQRRGSARKGPASEQGAERSRRTGTRAPAGGRARTGGRSRQSALVTTDHEAIRRWVEERGGHPATVSRTVRGKQDAGVIRIDFPGYSGANSLKPIGWDEWFATFEERKLAFLHQDTTANGKPSRFNKLVSRED